MERNDIININSNDFNLPENSLFRIRPELIQEWDTEENNKNGIYIEKITKGSKKKVAWICHKCNNKFEQRPLNRTYGQNCPYCSGREASNKNSLASLNPVLAKEWHPIKNKKLTPHNVTSKSNQKVWWLGVCGHEWDATIDNRSNGTGCPYCTKKKIHKGFGDLWSTHPTVADMLLNKEEGYSHTYGSNNKTDWICQSCNLIIREKTVKGVVSNGLNCPCCSSSISFPERAMSKILYQSNINFIHDRSFRWSEGRRYDFYLPEYNMIIETHGLQHYKESTRKGDRIRSLLEEQNNDKYKQQLAKDNEIDYYVEIDCRFSDINHIYTSISNSILLDVFPDILNKMISI